MVRIKRMNFCTQVDMESKVVKPPKVKEIFYTLDMELFLHLTIYVYNAHCLSCITYFITYTYTHTHTQQNVCNIEKYFSIIHDSINKFV